jgi:hypothetical protein
MTEVSEGSMVRNVDVVEITGPTSYTRLSSFLLRGILTQLCWPQPTDNSMELNETQEETFRCALAAACTPRPR